MSGFGRVVVIAKGIAAKGIAAMGIAAGFGFGPATAQTFIDAGKSPQQLFASDCAVCHKSPQGLAKSGPMFLQSFLRQHYTASRETAQALSDYLTAVGDPSTAPKPARPVKKREAKPAAAKPADAKPSDAKSGDAKPAEAKPAEAKPAEAKPAEAKPAEAAPAKSE